MRETPRFVAGSRFRYIPDSINFTYENLVNAIGEAINKEADENGNKYVTDKRQNEYKEHAVEMPPFAEMKAEAEILFGDLLAKDGGNKLKIAKIINEYLGVGKKFQDTTELDAEKVWLIIQELRVLNK